MLNVSFVDPDPYATWAFLRRKKIPARTRKQYVIMVALQGGHPCAGLCSQQPSASLNAGYDP